MEIFWSTDNKSNDVSFLFWWVYPFVQRFCNLHNKPTFFVFSRLACQAIRQLHPEAIAAIQSKVLFSKAEEQLLSTVSSVSTKDVCKVLKLVWNLLCCTNFVFSSYRAHSPHWRSFRIYWPNIQMFSICHVQLNPCRSIGSLWSNTIF